MWSTYKESQLQFFFQYIKRPEASNDTFQVYGLAGSAVHDALEEWLETGKTDLHKFWMTRKVDNYLGMNGKKLEESKYAFMLQHAIKYVKDNYPALPDQGYPWNLTPERAFELPLYGIKVKGFIDLEVKEDLSCEVELIDWKTNSSNSHKLHKDQRLFYSWLYWKVEGIIPKCSWLYLKELGTFDDKGKPRGIHKDAFTEEEMIEFDSKIKFMLQDIVRKGFDIKNYEAGNHKGPFNAYKNLCIEEVYKRISGKNPSIRLDIKGHYVFINGPVDPLLEEGIDFATKFDLPTKYFMQQKVREKLEEGSTTFGRVPNLKDVGTIHLYNKRYKCFPIGLLDKIKKICNEYSEYYNKHLTINIKDHRNQKVMNQVMCNFKEELYERLTLRPYQESAVSKFISKQNGIIQIATGGGKTHTAGELIRELDAKTLWIIDRKELLNQTREALQKQLSIEIGIISGKDIDIKDITIATVQSLHAKLSDPIIQDYLYSVNFVIIDEFHKSAAETYQKVFAKLPNTKYKLGLTATPKRDDGKDPILFSILGGVIYKKTSQELIEEGYLVKPEIIFYHIDPPAPKLENIDKKLTYPEEYNEYITSHPWRNLQIMQFVADNKDKKIIILTKSIKHGKYLKDTIPSDIWVEHIHGKTTNRKEIYEKFTKGVYKCLVMTLSIGAEGLDIPDLDMIIEAAAPKGEGKSIQVLGRVLRPSAGKTKGIYIDFMDQGPYTRSHAEARIKAFKSEGHEVTVTTLPER